jgi:hypothetical protein
MVRHNRPKIWLSLILVLGMILGFLLDSSASAEAGSVFPGSDPSAFFDEQAGRRDQFCPALPAAIGTVITVSTVPELVSAVNHASSGETIAILDGVYEMDGAYLRMDIPGVTLRSASGIRDAVVLDGNYLTTEIIQIVASNVTVADLTLREAYYHPIHVSTNADLDPVVDVTGTLIYNVYIIDPRQQGIKINPNPALNATAFADDGVIACSHIELTDEGRTHVSGCYTGGIDAHQAQGWTIRDNLIEGFWCPTGLSEHAIHMWRSCKDTLILRNDLRNNARGVGLGLTTTGSGYRTYPGFTCPDASGYVDDYGGSVVNNVISAFDSGLFASQSGFDCGICFWNACDSRAYHNTIFTANPGATFSGIEWRFPNTTAEIYNNLSNEVMWGRENATGILGGNETGAAESWFVNPAGFDFHLKLSAVLAIDQGVGLAGVTEDYEGDPRPSGGGYDIGADERFSFDPTDWVFLPWVGR